MLVFPTLKPINKNTFSISSFEGMSRRVGAGNKTLFNTQNIASSCFPALSTRLGRKRVFAPQEGEKVTGIFIYNGVYVTTSYNGRTRLYFGKDFASLSCVLTLEEDDLEVSVMCFFNSRICLFNIGEQENVTETLLAAIISKNNYISRIAAPNFSDVTVYRGRIFGCSKTYICSCGYNDQTNWEADAILEDPSLGAYHGLFKTKSDFTACTTYKNRAFFFNADEMFELYGDDPTQFELVKIADVGCLCRSAISEVGGNLYFVSKEGVMKFNSATLTMVSDELYNLPKPYAAVNSAVVGGSGKTVYVRYDGEKESGLYSYNTESKFWTKEDDTLAIDIVNFGGRSLLLTEQGIWELEKDYTLDGEDNDGDSFPWQVETQDIHLNCSAKKRACSLEFCIRQPRVSRADVYVSYDGQEYGLVHTVSDAKNTVVCIPLARQEFDSIRIKICGSGQAQIQYINFKYTPISVQR